MAFKLFLPLRSLCRILLTGLLVSVGIDLHAFALLGPLKNRTNNAPDPWQGRSYGGLPGGLGYELAGDIGGPMSLNEAYRWNVPTVYYGFDPSFTNYFGQAGVDAVEAAFATLSALPPSSEMSPDLSEYPLDTVGENAAAASYNLIDLKSYTLALLLEQLGLANPERFVWGLRSREVLPTATNYSVVQMNYDPVTWALSTYVNGVHYNYQIMDPVGPAGKEWATAAEWYRLDPLLLPHSSVAGALGSADYSLGSSPNQISFRGMQPGQFFRGLTRDDVGGLRYLLSRATRFREGFPTGVTGPEGQGGFVDLALRGGVDKLNFCLLPMSAPGEFVARTNRFLDIFYTNDVAVTQSLQRVVVRPDILFRAEDLGGEVYRGPHPSLPVVFSPLLVRRTGVSHWRNNSLLHPGEVGGGGGPGVIFPGAVITFSTLGRYAANSNYQFQWGSFDASDQPPQMHLGTGPVEDAIVLETRLLRTNDVNYLESTLLLKRDWEWPFFRMEASTDLIQWEHFGMIDFIFTEPIAVWSVPATNAHRFFRAVKAEKPF